MGTVGALLKTKGNTVWSTTPDTSVYRALVLMAEKNVGALLVLESGKLAGIFSERDYARKVALKGKSAENTTVLEIMTDKVISIGEDQMIDDCMEMMTEKHVRHLPVTEGDKVIGLISIGDVVKSIIMDQKSTIGHLQDYITGKR